MGVADNGIAAILEIPTKALKSIQNAEEALTRLHDQSRRTAEQVYGDFANRMPRGVAKFISEVRKAKGELDKLSPVDVKLTVNTSELAGLKQLLTQNSMNISNIVQQLSLLGNNAAGAATQISKVNSEVNQQSDSASGQRTLLAEQNRLLNERLRLQRQLSNLAAVETKNTLLNKQPLSADQMGLRSDLIKRIREIDSNLNTLAAKYDTLTAKGQQAFNTRNFQGYLAWQKETIRGEEEITKARIKANELLNAQNKTSLQPTSEELSAQRQLQSLYAQRLEAVKKIEAQNTLLAASSRSANTGEIQYATALDAVIKKIDVDIASLAQKYPTLASAAKTAYESDKAMIMAEQNKKLATALEQVAAARSKDDVAKKVNEYKRLVTENERLAKAMREYVAAAGRVPARTDTSASAVAYREMEQQWFANESKRRQISAQNIDSIVEYERQRRMAENQQSISDFIQAEAQRTVEAKRQADERAKYQSQQSQKYFNSFKGATSYADVVMSDKNRGIAANTYENRARAIKNLETALKNLSKSDTDYANKVNEITRRLQILRQAQKEVNDEMRKKPQMSIGDAMSLANTAKATKSLKDYEAAYKALKDVMARTTFGSAEWNKMNAEAKRMKQNIDNIKAKMGELNSHSRRTSDIFSQVQNRLAAAFSVAAISGYIRKMIEVRAQFELQNVALRAILQNKDEADRIFRQVQQMALQSPFTIMQLTTYTKQLAAYRIEAEELVGTTKMLADVSAGLGVDMQRLILAYGQVKSANYLRATEVRQFTEAGLNISGELATYFSELQGRMVTVADVTDMITKRMVRFEDVEEVFRRVTSAGGLFYDMQKKQSESLYGQLQRITDAYNIMLNEIGQSNQGSISAGLQGIRSLISHWRAFMPLLKTVGAMMASVIAVKGIIAAIKGIQRLNVAIQTLAISWNLVATSAKAAKVAMVTTGVGALVVALGTLASVLMGLNDEANALAESLGRIGQESYSDMTQSIDKFKELTNVIQDVSASFEDRNKAYEEMLRTYSDILPSYALERSYIQSMGNDYSELTDRIKEYYQQKELTNRLDTLKSESNERKDALDQLQGMADRFFAMRLFDDSVTKSMARGFMQKLGEEMLSGEVEATAEAAAARFKEMIGEHFRGGWQEAIDSHGWLERAFSFDGQRNGNMQDVIENVVNYRNEIESAHLALSTVDNVEEALAANRRIRAQQVIDDADKETKAIQNTISSYYNMEKRLQSLKSVEDPTSTQQAAMRDLEAAIASARAEILEYASVLGLDLGEATLNSIKDIGDLNKILNVISDKAMPHFAAVGLGALGELKAETTGLNTAVNNLLTSLGYAQVQAKELGNGKITYMTNFVETPDAQKTRAEQAKAADEAQWRSRQELNDKIIKEQSKVNGVESKLFDNLRVSKEKGNKEYSKELIGEAERRAEIIHNIEAAQAQDTLKEYEAISGYTYDQLDQLKKEEKVLRDVAARYQPYDAKAEKKANKDADKELKDRFKSQLKALEDFYRRYEELRKDFSEGESQRQIKSGFADLFSQVQLDMEQVVSKGFDTKGLIANLEALKKTVPSKFNDIITDIQESISGHSIELEVKIAEESRERLQREIDSMFANYELSQEFSDLGINIDMTYVVGGRPTTLADVRKQLESMSTDMNNKSLEEQKIYQKALETLRNKEHQNQIARIKNYNKYLLESMSDRIQIELKAQREISAIRQDETLDDTTRQMAIMRRQQQMQSDLAKQEWKDFQSSDMYISMFEDMEHASTQSLEYMIAKLRSLKDSLKELPADQVRAIVKQIESVESQINKRNPFKALADNIGVAVTAYRNLGDASKDFQSVNQRYETAKKARDDYAAANLEYEQQLQIEEAKVGVDEDGLQIENEIIRRLREIIELRRAELKSMNITVEKLEVENNRLSNVVSNLKKGKEAAGQALQTIGAWGQEVANGIGEIGTSLENVFGAMSDGTADILSSAQEIIGGVANMASGVGRFMSGDYIGGAIQALSGLASTIGSIFAIGDKKKERQIQRLKEKVEDLDKAYQKLEKSIEEAYTFDDYNAGYTQAMKKLEAQKKVYKDMINLEESKKKTDADKVKEYKDKLEEIAEIEKQMRKGRIEDQGSTTDYLSEADSFVSAWLDAYREVGDGTDALKEHWDEFIDNLVVKQAASALVSRRLEKVIGKINAAIDQGKTGLDLSNAINEATAEWDAAAAQTNQALKEFFSAMGLNLGSSGDFILSDLQKGIQNITEPQAAAIEAYLNSMRFAVFRHTEQLDALIATIAAQYGSGVDNPVVSELKGIRSVLDSIDSRLRSVITSDAGRGAILKVG